MTSRKPVIAIVLAAALAAGVIFVSKTRLPDEPNAAFVLPVQNKLPKFSLVDQNGNAVTAESFLGQWDLVFFGFTHCPDICPVTLQILASAKRQLEESGADQLPRIVFVSVDPERDTPAQLSEYLSHFGDRNFGNSNLAVTGDLAELSKLTSALGIYFAKQAVVDGNYGVDHSAAVLVVNPDGEFYALFSAPHTIENYVHDLSIIMAAQ